MADENPEWDDEFPEDPRIKEDVAYAGTAVELILNAEFLLSEWAAAFLKLAPITCQRHLTVEQKFTLAAVESGLSEDDDCGGRAVYGFLLDLCRLRTRAGSMDADQLADRLMASFVRHCGEEAREECADCYNALGLMRQIVSGYLGFAFTWFVISSEYISLIDKPDYAEDPGWEPREGGSCNFISE